MHPVVLFLGLEACDYTGTQVINISYLAAMETPNITMLTIICS